MKVRHVPRPARFAAFVSLLMTAATIGTASEPTPSIRAAMSRLPLQFETNLGQTDPDIQYLSHGPNYSLFLTSTEAVLVLRRSGSSAPSRVQDALRMSLVGASALSRVAGIEELPGKVHYFIGPDPAKWRTQIATFAKVRYEEVYPGVDLIYRGSGSELEYDFVVSPGADPRAITLRFSGVEALCVDREGVLILDRGDGQARMHHPLVYQEVDGRREQIAGEYRIIGEHEVGFTLGRYDVGRPLIIDPILQYSTYLGGTQFDQAQAVALDSAGNTYLTGFTSSDDFPTVNPFQSDRGPGQSAFVSKLNASGTALVYSTYLGGDSNTAAFGVAVDAQGEAIVTGQTTSDDFPTLNAVQPTYGGIQDGFVTKLSADGSSLVFSTYLGGSGGDDGTAVALDFAGNAYVTGGTNSLDFPTLNSIRVPSEAALPDIFVAKLTPAGAFVYSTYLGASSEDSPFGIAVDAAGNAYVVGQTSSPDFPVTAGALDTTYSGGFEDGFALKLNAAGSAIVYATYLGGSGFDTASGVAVNTAGEAWVTGYTESVNFPSVHPLRAGSAGLPDAFVVKLNATGGGLLSTYLGGSSFDSGIAIAVDPTGNAYVTGGTASTDFPVVNAQQSALGGANDAYLTKIDPSGSRIVSSTYLGGSNDDIGIGIAANETGVLVTGNTFSPDFPVLNAEQSVYAGVGDAFAARFGGLDLFLRTTGSALALLAASPTSTAYTYRDSGAIKFAGGNPWVSIGTWRANPTPTGTLSTLAPLNAWIGLRNSDDVGTRFDVRMQLFRNGVLISEGMTRCVQNLNRNPATSTAIAVPFGSFSPLALTGSDALTLGVATRIGTDASDGPCGGHVSATGLRVYFDSVQQPSSFTAGFAP